jgi:hypothetical protein
MRTPVLALAFLPLAAGCNPTYAPPIRAVQYGAPARLEQGRVEFGGTLGGVIVPNVAGPHVAVGVSDLVALEAGGNFLYDEWAMGFVGARFSFAGDRRRRGYLIADLELGVGGGVGGSLEGNQAPDSGCATCDGRSTFDRVAYGGYQGAGLGARIRWLSIYGRVRVEETTATNVPLTLWPSASVGMEFRPSDRVALNLAAGVMGYSNSRDSAVGWFYQVGVTLFFDTRTPAPAPPAAAPWAPRPPLTPVPPPTPPAPFDDDCD